MEKQKTKPGTELQILKAAQVVFIKKGLEGARMQEIANEAGIDEALLHDCFCSKEKLFNRIFENGLTDVFEVINESIHEEGNVFIFIETFVDNYLSILQKNPFIPNFIFNEINNNPNRIKQFRSKMGLNVPGFKHMIEKNIAEKKIIKIAPEHLLINILGMCIFPYIGLPLLEKVFFGDRPAGAGNFLLERKQHIISFLKIALQPQKNF